MKAMCGTQLLMQQLLQVLKMTEQAFLIFLEDEQEAFRTITNHAARRRALRDQSSSTLKLGHLPDTGLHVHIAHVDLIAQMGLAMSQLPGGGGDAARQLLAVTALLGATSTPACLQDYAIA